MDGSVREPGIKRSEGVGGAAAAGSGSVVSDRVPPVGWIVSMADSVAPESDREGTVVR